MSRKDKNVQQTGVKRREWERTGRKERIEEQG